MSFKTWLAEKKFQMSLGMQMQLDKYPEGDPRRAKLQKMTDKMRNSMEEAEDGSDPK